jgi:hypothetical protein
MRFWRMAAGRRVCGQACVSAVPRCQRGSGRRPIEPKSRKCHISQAFAQRRVARSAWHSCCNHPWRRTGRAQFGMFTQRMRGGWRGGFLLGAARRGVAF